MHEALDWRNREQISGQEMELDTNLYIFKALNWVISLHHVLILYWSWVDIEYNELGFDPSGLPGVKLAKCLLTWLARYERLMVVWICVGLMLWLLLLMWWFGGLTWFCIFSAWLDYVCLTVRTPLKTHKLCTTWVFPRVLEQPTWEDWIGNAWDIKTLVLLHASMWIRFDTTVAWITKVPSLQDMI